MSFVLNVSNDNSNPNEFCINDIEVSVDSKKRNWLKRTHVGKFLGIENIRTSLNDLDKCEILTRQELVPTPRGTPGWSGPKDQQNKADKFLSFFGVMHVNCKLYKRQGQDAQRAYPERHRTTWA